MNQLVFLSMVLDKNQKPNQDVRKLVSLISDEEISYLIDNDFVTLIEKSNTNTYKPTDKLLKLVTPEKSYFDQFFEMYPQYVLRPDGAKSYLRTNLNKCRHLYNVYTGNSSAYAEHINNCLKYEIDKKMREGKLGYFKTMWKWLTDHQWEESEEEMNDTQTNQKESYGTELI